MRVPNGAFEENLRFGKKWKGNSLGLESKQNLWIVLQALVLKARGTADPSLNEPEEQNVL